MNDEQRTICVGAENKPGVLMRVIGIITAKGANIELVIAGADPNREGRSEILIVATLEGRLQGRVVREINRLVNVFHAVDVTGQGLNQSWLNTSLSKGLAASALAACGVSASDEGLLEVGNSEQPILCTESQKGH